MDTFRGGKRKGGGVGRLIEGGGVGRTNGKNLQILDLHRLASLFYACFTDHRFIPANLWILLIGLSV